MISSSALEIVARLEKDAALPDLEREGRIKSILIIRNFARGVETVLSDSSWPNRDDRTMAGRAFFRGIMDMGWYTETKISDSRVAQLMDDALRLAENYRRLPEARKP